MAFSGGRLKRQEPNIAFQTEGEYKCSSIDSVRKIKCCLTIKACKHVLIKAQNANMNLETSTIGPF